MFEQIILKANNQFEKYEKRSKVVRDSSWDELDSQYKKIYTQIRQEAYVASLSKDVKRLTYLSQCTLSIYKKRSAILNKLQRTIPIEYHAQILLSLSLLTLGQSSYHEELIYYYNSTPALKQYTQNNPIAITPLRLKILSALLTGYAAQNAYSRETSTIHEQLFTEYTSTIFSINNLNDVTDVSDVYNKAIDFVANQRIKTSELHSTELQQIGVQIVPTSNKQKATRREEGKSQPIPQNAKKSKSLFQLDSTTQSLHDMSSSSSTQFTQQAVNHSSSSSSSLVSQGIWKDFEEETLNLEEETLNLEEETLGF